MASERPQEYVLPVAAKVSEYFDDFDGIGARLPLNGKHNGAVPIKPARRFIVLHAIDTRPIRSVAPETIAVCDNHRSELARISALPVRKNGERACSARTAFRSGDWYFPTAARFHLVDADLP